jgi:hypothetical protein
MPAQLSQAANVARIPQTVRVDLCAPEFDIALWGDSPPLVMVPMPKAAVHEDHPALRDEYQIRFTG